MRNAAGILIYLSTLAVPALAADPEPSGKWFSVPEPQMLGLVLWSALVLYLRRRTRGR